MVPPKVQNSKVELCDFIILDEIVKKSWAKALSKAIPSQVKLVQTWMVLQSFNKSAQNPIRELVVWDIKALHLLAIFHVFENLKSVIVA